MGQGDGGNPPDKYLAVDVTNMAGDQIADALSNYGDQGYAFAGSITNAVGTFAIVGGYKG